MKISLSMPKDSMVTSTGFGNAGYRLTRALQDLGHEVPFRDPAAPVEINWAHPSNWVWSNPNAYHIGYTPWESSIVPPSWLQYMRKADEVWTASPLMARWIEQETRLKVKVLQHGVDGQLWRAKRRIPEDIIKFLHCGEPAPRKAGQMAVDAFRKAFGDSEKVKLTIKAYNYSTIRGKYNNIVVDKRDVVDSEMADIFRNHDALIYPSYGEGFGFIPLEAMVSGMPTVCTTAWAPYKKYILPELRLKSKVIDSPWPEMHPGKMFEPDFDQLVDIYRYAASHIDELADKAYAAVPSVSKEYDWNTLVYNAFEPVVKKIL